MKFKVLIHHLDEGEELDEVLDCLKKDGIVDQFEMRLPDYDINEISIFAGTQDEIEQLQKLIEAFSDNTLQTLQDMQLSISVFIDIDTNPASIEDASGLVTSFDQQAYLNTELLQLLSNKDIAIFINTHAFGY